jgi:hypothetical protein
MEGDHMTFARFVVCLPACLLLADTAIAGNGLGAPLGITLGQVLGVLPLGSALPIAGLGLLGVAAAGLAIGVRIIRRKRRDK